MPNIDDKGNKIAAKKEKKTVISKQIRLCRLSQGQDLNPKICVMCGFRIRSKNHTEGKHHRGRSTNG